MKRVTGSRVVKAYKATGFVPTQHEYYSEAGRWKFACGLTTLAVHEKDAPEPERIDCHGRLYGSTAIDRLKLSVPYATGFMMGWDGDSPKAFDVIWNPVYGDGYDDGVRARKAVVKAGLAEFDA